jgi:ADP-heptose:LPS heptosyltransferase
MPRTPRSLSMERLQRADSSWGRAVCLALQPWRLFRRRKRSNGPVRRVLMIKFWGLGSLQLLTPATRALRERHPGAQLTLLTLSQNQVFARGLGLWDEVVVADVRVPSWPRVACRLLGLFWRLRRGRYDRVYDFEFFTRVSAVAAFVTGAPWTVGFASERVWRGALHRERVQFNRYWHVARNFYALAGGSGELGALTPYAPSHAERARVRDLLKGPLAQRPYVVLNANAGELSLERRWPTGHFADLARRLTLEDGLRVVWIGGSNERDHVDLAARAALPLPAGSSVQLAGELNIGELCALLDGAAAVVSNDSGPMHLAAALDVPTIGLFGPETPVMYAPLGTHTAVFYRPPQCSPCINVHDNKLSNCVLGRPECLVSIEVAEVRSRTLSLIESAREEGRAAPLHA